jgi:hypothetical protein
MPFLTPFWGSVLLLIGDASPFLTFKTATVTSDEKKKGRLKVLRFAARKRTGPRRKRPACSFYAYLIVPNQGKPFQDRKRALNLTEYTCPKRSAA